MRSHVSVQNTFIRGCILIGLFNSAGIKSATATATPDTTYKGDKVGSPSVVTQEKQAGSKAEEAKIAELLNRGDTAIIYPEPCSDNEEHPNNEGTVSYVIS